MNTRTLIIGISALTIFSLPLVSLASGNGGKVLGVLQEAKNNTRLQHATGIIGGMTQKLQNLSQQLDQHQLNVENRISTIKATGHDIHVDTQLSAFKDTVSTAKTAIQSTIDALQQIPESSNPGQLVAQVRTLVRDLAIKLTAVRTAFLTLQQAVVQQLQAEHPSPTPTV